MFLSLGPQTKPLHSDPDLFLEQTALLETRLQFSHSLTQKQSNIMAPFQRHETKTRSAAEISQSVDANMVERRTEVTTKQY